MEVVGRLISENLITGVGKNKNDFTHISSFCVIGSLTKIENLEMLLIIYR